LPKSLPLEVLRGASGPASLTPGGEVVVLPNGGGFALA
jgi:hypothetical protein